MPMFNLNYDTASSFSTAMLSGTLGNFLSILMKTHPGTTLEGANTILQENYLREEKFKYVDETEGRPGIGKVVLQLHKRSSLWSVRKRQRSSQSP